jgi:arylsulfatase A-like enzyme
MNFKFTWIILLLSFYSVAQQAAKPNIVLIFADDMGYKDCGFTGSSFCETPNIDALSKKGMVFSNAYAGGGNCAPSRACLMSGLYTPRHGVYAVGSTTRGPRDKMRLVPVKNTNDLNPDFITVAEALKGQGYTTGIFGKWHLGTTKNVLPTAQGFDEYFDSRMINPNKERDAPKDLKGVFSNTEAAIKFMEANKTKPFFAYLSHHAIHTNLEGKPETIDYFKRRGLDDKKALYAACAFNMDESIGIVIDYLKRSGLDKNTLVIFTSDNGATQQSSQEPLRGNKGSYYEGGIREPFIAYWPGKIKAGAKNNTPIINLDLYPTFLTLAGNDKINLDGENLLPLFFDERQATIRQNIFWNFPGYLNDPVIRGRDAIFRTRPVVAMRKGDWKILVYYEEWLLDGGKKNIDKNNSVEIYNLMEDEGERKNQASINAKKRDELVEDVLVWLKKTKAPMPVKMDTTHPLDDSDGGEDN